MAGGIGAGSFAAGFGQSLANALLERHKEDREDKRKADERAFGVEKLKLETVLPQLINSPDMIDEQVLASEFPSFFKGKEGSARAQQIQAAINNARQQGLWDKGTTADTVAGGGVPVVKGYGSEADPLLNTPKPVPTLFGAPLHTPEQKDARAVNRAREVYRQMHAADPTFTMDDAFAVAGIKLPRDPYSAAAARPQSIAGEYTDDTGKVHTAYGVFTAGKYIDADTGQPIKGFRPRTTTGSTSMGVDREALARAMFGGQRFVDLTPDQQQQVLDAEKTRAGQMAESRGLGTGRAKIETDLNTPIGTTAGMQYNVPPTTTLAQLAATTPLTAEQREKIASLSQFESVLGQIDQLLPQVFPDVQPGIRGRIKTQLSLGLQKVSADEDYAQLESAIKLALAQVAQLAGQPGSRLSDRDVKNAEASMAQLSPSIFGGDTLKSARARMQILHDLLEKAKGTTVQPAAVLPKPGATVPPPAAGGAPPPATTPGGLGIQRRPDGLVQNGVYITGPRKGQKAQ
jgi:hypothetical protein